MTESKYKLFYTLVTKPEFKACDWFSVGIGIGIGIGDGIGIVIECLRRAGILYGRLANRPYEKARWLGFQEAAAEASASDAAS